MRLQLDLLGFKDYKEFLNSSLWADFRSRLRKAHNCSKCARCGSTEGINLHHMSYKALLDPANIAVLCRDCHKIQHTKVGINYGLKNSEQLKSQLKKETKEQNKKKKLKRLIDSQKKDKA